MNEFSWKKATLVLCVVAFHLVVNAQNTGNLASRSYDTVLTGIGYGTYSVNLPKWSPDSGLLVSVKISLQVAVHYTYTLQNIDHQPTTYSLMVGREDPFTSPALNRAYTNGTEQNLGDIPLAPGDIQSQGPLALFNGYTNVDSITDNITPFLGSDAVNFTYSPITFTNLRTNNNTGFAFHASAQDTMHFNVTYFYVKTSEPAVVLPIKLTGWSAVAEEPSTVNLSWSVANETTGGEYRIQRSANGQDYVTVTTLPATGGQGGSGNYTYPDHLPERRGGTWFYRLQIKENEHISYSGVSKVTLRGDVSDGNGTATAEKEKLPVFPNPATTFINITPGSDLVNVHDWQVDIFTATGALIQRNTYHQTGTFRVDFIHPMPPGTYFVRATDIAGQKTYTTSFVVVGN